MTTHHSTPSSPLSKLAGTRDSGNAVITLKPRVDPWGDVVWADPSDPGAVLAPTTSEPPSGMPVRQDLHLSQGGAVASHSGSPAVSVLPTERMAATDAWADIVQNLRMAEEGRPHRDITMQPGGALEVTGSGPARPLSKVPQERMAAANVAPTARDIADVMLLDPQRVESWSPVTTDLLNGWTFRLRPEPHAPEFVFLAFRNPSDGNWFRIFVIQPNVDSQYGHREHMIATVVGGQRIPVLCGPGGRAAKTLAEARLFAAKWAAYTYRRTVLGVRPGFSE